MRDLLKAPFVNASAFPPFEVGARLLMAVLLGAVVAFVYRRTRVEVEPGSTFPSTLVLLTVLIAMVTQVIGDNVARAFSLVGALSIVRFRTVVRDTRDTAFVIFAVVVGMAAGAGDLWVSLVGLVVVSGAAYAMRGRTVGVVPGDPMPFVLSVRLGIGHDLETLLQAVEPYVADRRLIALGTAQQGLSIDVTYEAHLRPRTSPDELVKAANAVEGVQSVDLKRRDASAT